jgi:hypothetical protein
LSAPFCRIFLPYKGSSIKEMQPGPHGEDRATTRNTDADREPVTASRRL